MNRRDFLRWLPRVAAPWAAASLAHAADWPQFRGADGQGHSSETGLPLEWSESSNIAWKTPLAGLGWSSPAVVGNQVWLTTAHEPSRTLRAICLDRETGVVRHDVEVFRLAELPRIAAKNSHASATPLVEGDAVYVHFGSQGTACLTRDGRLVWRVVLDYDQHHGPGASPVVWRDLLIVPCDGFESQYTLALDKRDGQVRWKQQREGQMSYSTPLVINVRGADQLICDGGGAIVARNPANGDEIWRYRHDGHSVVPRPVFAGDVVYACSGYWTPRLYAIRADGQGDVTDSHLLWSGRRSVPLTPSPLIAGEELYMISDQGVFSCLSARGGQEYWRHRFAGAFSASPVLADGNIYLLSEEGTTYVVSATSQFQLLATNQLAGRALASPAVAGGSIFLRTDTHVYRIRAAT
jgi:outer membrane protein assembly factor BamB